MERCSGRDQRPDWAKEPAMDVADWLRALGLERYEAAFRENVSAEDLCHLTTEDLEGLGIAAIGHRRRLLKRKLTFAEALTDPAFMTVPRQRLTMFRRAIWEQLAAVI
jgi:hypothetical protein